MKRVYGDRYGYNGSEGGGVISRRSLQLSTHIKPIFLPSARRYDVPVALFRENSGQLTISHSALGACAISVLVSELLAYFMRRHQRCCGFRPP